MAEITKSRKYVKPARKVRLEEPFGMRLLVITETAELKAGPRVKVTSYRLREVPSDFGRAFELRKLEADGGEVYHVNLADGPDGPEDSCECKGHLRHGHRTVCRHVAGLKALAAAGKL
jgi:hypothetical protein